PFSERRSRWGVAGMLANGGERGEEDLVVGIDARTVAPVTGGGSRRKDAHRSEPGVHLLIDFMVRPRRLELSLKQGRSFEHVVRNLLPTPAREEHGSTDVPGPQRPNFLEEAAERYRCSRQRSYQFVEHFMSSFSALDERARFALQEKS